MNKFKTFWSKSLKNKVIVIFVVLVLVSMVFGNGDSSVGNNPGSSNNTTQEARTVVEVEDLTTKTTAEIDLWCDEMKVTCKSIEDYSDTVKKGEIVGQSVGSGNKVYEGDAISIIYSLGKKPSAEFLNALDKAESYATIMNMSKAAIYDQLISKYGEQFPKDAAQYAVDNVAADWNANALAKADSYANTMDMSKDAVYDQLVSKNGEKFTAAQAKYAINNLVADWNANALAKAKSYQTNLKMSKNAIYDQLVSSYGEKFTAAQAKYAISHL